MSTFSQNFTTWMTYRQASELNAHVRKGEKGALVVYAYGNANTRTAHEKTREDIELFLDRVLNARPCLARLRSAEVSLEFELTVGQSGTPHAPTIRIPVGASCVLTPDT